MQQTLSADSLNDYVDQSLRDTLALMKRFEDTGMDVIMKEDYLALYDIYQRLLEQKQSPPAPHRSPEERGEFIPDAKQSFNR